MKVLITTATSARAQKLKKSLLSDEVLLGDHQEMPAFMGMIKLPNPASDTYTHEMLTLCLDNNIDTLYLLSPHEAQVLLTSEQLFKEYNINIVNGGIDL